MELTLFIVIEVDHVSDAREMRTRLTPLVVMRESILFPSRRD